MDSKMQMVVLAVFLAAIQFADSMTPEKEFVCDRSNNAVETEMYCHRDSELLTMMASQSKFFANATLMACSDAGGKVYSDEEEVLVFSSKDGGLTLSGHCLNENQVIVKLKMCVKDAHVHVLTLHCYPISDSGRLGDVFNVTSKAHGDISVDCGERAAIQKIYFMDAGNGVHTRVVFTCVKFHGEDSKM